MKRIAAAIAALSITAAAGGGVVFDGYQRFNVSATSFWQALVFDYTTRQSSTLSVVPPGAGHVSVSNMLYDHWTGVWLYDYGQGTFVEAFIFTNINAR